MLQATSRACVGPARGRWWHPGSSAPSPLCIARPRGAPAWRSPIPTSLPPAGHRLKNVAPRCSKISSWCRHLAARWRWCFGVGAAGSAALGASGPQNPTVEEASSPDPVSSHLWGIFFGSGFGFSSSVMVFSLLSPMQSSEQGCSRPSRGGLAGVRPRRMLGPPSGRRNNPPAVKEPALSPHPSPHPHRPAGVGTPRVCSTSPPPALPSGIPKSPFLGRLASGTKTFVSSSWP